MDLKLFYLVCFIILLLFAPIFSGDTLLFYLQDIDASKEQIDLCEQSCIKLNATTAIYEDIFFSSNCICIINNNSVKLW